MMTEKRYYQRDFEELYYIIDSHKISEKDFDEKVEYDGYNAFEDSLTGEEIVKLLNENEQLKSELATQGTQLDFIKDENKHMKTVLNENKQLKQQLKICFEHYKCILDETVICNQCQECSKLSADYTADIMRGI